MSTGYKIIEQDKLHFITLQVVEWIDIFTRKSYRDIIIENLKYCQDKKGLEIYGWVIMSNHIHMLVRSNENNLSGTLKDFKSYTSKQILEEIRISDESRREWLLQLFKNAARNHQRNSKYQFWTHDNHAEYIYSDKFIEQKLQYIHNNPIRAGIVAKPEDYLYSSALDYAEDTDGLLKVERVMRKWKSYR
jgi:REP element-mobilizing transposase RayT